MAHRWRVDWCAEAPFLLLLASALMAPVVVVQQGGDWHTAVTACIACLAAPGLGMEAMFALVRVVTWTEGPQPPKGVGGRGHNR